jgi:3-hydroxyisobutyrate dehydrogenase-like beta-hydroxyacid dehydrogenase
MHIAYLGLGNMGAEISARLATYAKDHGHSLTVWNRSQDKYAGLRAKIDATFAAELEQIRGADVVFLMVLNDQASAEVLARVLDICPTAVVVDQSSVNPKTSIANEKAAAATGAKYLAAPVFGRPDAAAAGKLIQVVSGDRGAQEKVKPLFDVSARAVLNTGAEVYKATTVKLMGNAMILGMMEMLAEVYALGDATGIEPDVFQQFVEMFFPTPSYQVYGRKIGQGSFSAAGGFRLEGGLKDANNILSVGEDLGHPVPLPTIALAKQHMLRAVEMGGQGQDWSSLSAAVREEAGLEPYRKKQE